MLWSQFRKTKKALDGLPISAKVIVETRGGKILLLRKAGRALHDLPGGKIEQGEDLFDGLKREVWEETSLRLKRFDFVASWIKQQQGLGPRLMIVFKSSLRQPARKLPIVLSDEHDWARFLSPEKAVKRAMDPGYCNAISSAGQLMVKG